MQEIPDAGAAFHSSESLVFAAVQWVRLAVETFGAIVVLVGILSGVWLFLRVALLGDMKDYGGLRLVLARYLALALEFQLAADILSTAISPSWDAIGRLAAIAVIRTGLNFFLSREMQEFRVAKPGPGPREEEPA
jgi:uncharacterized membrane protein